LKVNRRINYRELRQAYEADGARQFCREMEDALERGRKGQPGGLSASDFSLREIAEECVKDGREWVRNMDPRFGSSVMESSAGVDSSAFSNITGQLLINQVMGAYQSEEFIFSRLVNTVSTRLSGERIPGITGIGDKAEVVREGMPFPNVGVGEDYIDTPATVKDGLIVPITKEAIFFDRTGVLLQQASKVGEALGIRKEKQIIDIVIGATNNYKWKGTSYNTYQASTPWINNLSGAGNALNDWSSVELAEALFDEMLDPNTGEPVILSAVNLVACPAKRHTINRILNATEVRYTASGAASETLAPNPLANAGYSGATSRLLYRRLIAAGKTGANAKQTWFLGDMNAAFAYMENWPITVVQAPNNSEAEFNQDIVARYKASERGVAAVMEPRKVVKVDGHA
jgi:hypothetical protein